MSKPEPTRTNGAIREFLRKEIPGWVESGLLTEIAAAELRERYELDKPGRSAAPLLSIVILSIGGLLLGVGVLSVVAANWKAIPREGKIAGVFALLLGFHIAAVLCARSGRARLGVALNLAGCLCVGGGIGLMAQLFHIPKFDETAFGIWALACLAMAWAYPSAVVAMLALAISWWWFGGEYPGYHRDATLVWRLYPVIVAAGVVSLAIVQRSRVLFTLGLATLIVSGGCVGGWRAGLLGLVAIAFLSWSLGAALSSRAEFDGMGRTARAVGFLGLAAAAYVWGFHEFWRAVRYSTDKVEPQSLVTVGVAVVAALACLVVAVRRRSTGGVSPLVFRLVLAAGAILAALGVANLLREEGYIVLAPIAANTAALLLASAAIASGFSEARRSHFWAGTTFLVLVIATRFLEIRTGLVAKGLICMALGVGVMYAGILYERYLKKRGEVAL